jgi:hypothetical protein
LRCCLALSLLLVLVLGCGSSEALVPVAAHVMHGGKPLTTGTVSYRPDAAKGNKSLHHPTGTIDDQGNYRLHTSGSEGAPPGWYKVVVFANEKQDDAKKAHPGMPKSIIPARYNEDKTTPLSVEVKADAAAGSYDLKLEK